MIEIPGYNHKLYEALEEAHRIRFSEPQKALDSANYVYIQSLKSGDEKLEAKSLYEMGLCFELSASYAQSMKCLTESIKIANSLGDFQIMADSLNCIGIIHDKLNNYSNALKAYHRALKLYEALESKKKIAIVLSNIGLIYTNINDFKSSLKYYSQALDIAEEEKDNESLLVTNINLGLTHQKLGNLKDAERFLADALKLAGDLNDKHRKSIAIDIIAEIESTYDHVKAFDTLQQSLVLKNELNDKRGISKIYSFLGQLQLMENRLDEAEVSFLKALEISLDIGLKKSIYEIYKFLSEIYEKKDGPRKALDYLQLAYKKEIEYLKEESEVKAKNIATQLEIEQAQKEAEIERLKNVELAKALDEVKQLNISLNELNIDKNEFMAIAVHDLKNPLQNILSTARIIKNTESLSEDQIKDFTVNIINQTGRMFGLIKKLLDHNAIEQGNIESHKSSFSLKELCNELVYNFIDQADKKELSLLYRNYSENVILHTDKILLYEILQNIVSNAIKFSPPGKTVTIQTQTSGDNVLIEIIDEGPGFTEKDKERLFSKFAKLSAKPTGNEHSTGLGLSIVKKLCEFIGAQVWLESAPGEGAKFVVKINDIIDG
jgi:signal transduction histidine kinase